MRTHYTSREARLVHQMPSGETPVAPHTETNAHSMEDIGRTFGDLLQRFSRSLRATTTDYREAAAHAPDGRGPSAPQGTRFQRLWDAFLRGMQPTNADSPLAQPGAGNVPNMFRPPVPTVNASTTAPTVTPPPTITTPPPSVTPRPNPEPLPSPEQIRDRAQTLKQATDAAFSAYTNGAGDATTTDAALVSRTKQAISDELAYRGTHTRVLNDPARYSLLQGMWPQLRTHDMLIRARSLKAASDAAGAAFAAVRDSAGADRIAALQGIINANEAERSFLSLHASYDQALVNGKGFTDFIGEGLLSRLAALQKALPDWRARLSDRFRDRRNERGAEILDSRSDEWKRETSGDQTYWVQNRTFIRGYPPRFAFIDGLWKINHNGRNGSYEDINASVRTGSYAAQANAMISALRQVNANNFAVEAPAGPAVPDPPAEGLPLG